MPHYSEWKASELYDAGDLVLAGSELSHILQSAELRNFPPDDNGLLHARRLLARLDSRDLLAIDYGFRDAYPLAENPRHPLRFEYLQSSSCSVFDAGLYAMHRNGFVREAAVRVLAKHQTGDEIPFLLLRTLDWVEPVRRQARNALVSRIVPANAEHFVRHLGVLAALRRSTRHAIAPEYEAIADLVVSEHGAPHLVAELLDRTSHVRKAAMQVLMSASAVGSAAMLLAVAPMSDPAIQRLALKWTRNGVYDPEIVLSYLTQTVVQADSRVRAAALRSLAERFRDEATPYLERALWDSGRSPRAVARFFLQRSRETYRELYASRLRIDDPLLPVAIAGLSETGTAADAALTLPFAHHPSSRVRTAAVEALHSLDANSHMDVLFDAILDRSPSVARAAARAVASHLAGLRLETLSQMFQNALSFVSRRAILHALGRSSSWRVIEPLLSAIAHDDPRVRQRAEFSILRWLSRVNHHGPPPAGFAQEMLILLHSRADYLPDRLFRELHRFLETL